MKDSILTKLENQHQILYQQLDAIEESLDYFERRDLFNQLKSSLVAHMQTEEVVIYQKLLHDIPDKRAKELGQLSDEEHHVIKEYLQRLNLMNFGSREWIHVYKSFNQLVNKHFRDEELNLFCEIARDYSQEELIELGEHLEEAMQHQPWDHTNLKKN
jgi:IS1 family transposase